MNIDTICMSVFYEGFYNALDEIIDADFMMSVA